MRAWMNHLQKLVLLLLCGAQMRRPRMRGQPLVRAPTCPIQTHVKKLVLLLLRGGEGSALAV
jgi:hypothetical protein